MNIIPYWRFFAVIICFGFTFYFLNLTFSELTTAIPTTGAFFAAMLTLWSALPGIVLLRSGVKMVMTLQKRGGPY